MEETTVLGHYRMSVDQHGEPRELSETGSVATYEAVDERSGDTVAVTLIPISNIDPALREQVEEQARAAQKLRHINVAKVLDFGHEGENFVYISEHLPGETLVSWVAAHGPMPSDAVLRVANQVVNALSVANFHKLIHPAIQPSNLMMVAGPTPEGGWPFVKLMNFGLAGIKIVPGSLQHADSSADMSGAQGKPEKGRESFSVAHEFASPEQLHNQPVDFSSEIYSLGATMYFLLTGVAPSAVMRRHQLRILPKPLRNLLAQMLCRAPDRRPKDAAALEKMIHQCLVKIERRQALADRYGIPFRTTLPRPAERQSPVLRRALAVGSLVLAAALIAGVLLQNPINRIWHPYRGSKEIGVLVGVPESSPPPVIQNPPTTPTEPANAVGVLSQAAKNALAITNQSAANQSTATNSEPPPPDNQQTQASNAQPESTTAPGSSQGEAVNPSTTGEESLARSKTESPSVNAARPSSSTKRPMASTSQRRPGTVRARMIGITRDGRLIYRFPSGRVAIEAPDSDQDEFVPRRQRRIFTEPDQTFSPTPRFAPDYFPND